MPRRTPWLNFGLISASIAVSFLLIEAGLRLFSPFELRLLGDEIRLPYFKRYEITIENPKRLEPVVIHTRNALGFRGPERPADFDRHLTIVAIGGSATEGFVLGDGKDWPAVLGRGLAENLSPVWVNNAGLNGHTTYGHIQLMRQHILRLRPDVALFLVGVNDTTFDDNTARFDSRLTSAQEDLVENVVRSVRMSIARHSHLGALLFNIYRQLKAAREGFIGDQMETDLAAVSPSTLTEAEIQAVLADHKRANYNGYAARLTELIELSRRGGIEPVFITQPTLYGPVVDDVSGVDIGRITGAQWRLIQAYNEELKRVGEAHDALVIDLATAMPKSTRYFYDFWHFTNEGAERVAEIIYRELCPFLSAKFPEHVSKPCGRAS